MIEITPLTLGSLSDLAKFIDTFRTKKHIKQMVQEMIYRELRDNLSILMEVKSLVERAKEPLSEVERIKLLKYLKFDASDVVARAGLSLKAIMDWHPEFIDEGKDHGKKISDLKTMPEMYIVACHRFKMQRLFAEEGINKRVDSLDYAIALGDVVKKNLEKHLYG